MLRTGSISSKKRQAYTSSDDFATVFGKDTASLYLLSLLLTADHAKAEQCFVSGLEDCVSGHPVFRDWARSWARRRIICNAVRMFATRWDYVTAMPMCVDSFDCNFGQTPEAKAAIASILRLRDFERFVFVMSVVERYSDWDCSVLLSSSRQDVAKARTRALQNLAESGLAATSLEPETPILLRDSRTQRLAAVVFVIALILGCTAAFLNPQRAAAQAQFAASKNPHTTSAFVVGFVGGFVHVDDLRHSEAQVARQLQTTYGNTVQVQMFENRRTREAHKLILDWLDRQGEGKLTDDEKRNARIILFGHSWGASAVVSLARELQQDGIPVSLTIQVDSIRKNGVDDSTIPPNVAEAVNFYQTDGLLHGRPEIRAADPSHTRILGNFRFKYEKEPAECRVYPWYDRLLFKGHTAIECDPSVWSQVETLIRMRLSAALPPAQTQVAARAGN